MTDQQWMRQAMNLALKARGKTSPNPMVGAVIVRNNRLLAQGWHKRCGADHAEVMALKALKKSRRSAKGAKFYVTLEPCFHYGRTPPCIDAIMRSGIKEVIIGMRDPNPRTNGQSIAQLRRSGIKVRVGILEPELKAMNEMFIKYITTGLPFVVAKCAQTLDGKVATERGASKWITSNETRDYARGLRDQFDAILVGINTVLKDDPSLKARSNTKQIKKIVVDSSLKIPLRARLFNQTSPAQCFIATTSKASRRKLNIFQKKGINVIICPQQQGRIHLKWLFKELAKRGITNILIEGGPTIVGDALKAGLVDKMHIYIAPKIFGDQTALDAVNGFKIKDVHRAIQLKGMEFNKIGKDIFIQGYV